MRCQRIVADLTWRADAIRDRMLSGPIVQRLQRDGDDADPPWRTGDKDGR